MTQETIGSAPDPGAQADAPSGAQADAQANAQADAQADAQSGAAQDPEKIRSMFAAITPSYDRLNHLFSASMDRRWRAIAAQRLTDGLNPCRTILDVATGTGDLAKAVQDRAAHPRVVGLDFTRAMLKRGSEKYGTGGGTEGGAGGLHWIEGDGLRLPFKSGSFDAVCIAFGLRNMVDRAAGLAEMRRVTRPGGRIGILEFSRPRGRITARLYDVYVARIMPIVGRMLSGSGAYGYLSSSIQDFWPPERMSEEMSRAGMVHVRRESLAAGMVYFHLGEIPAPR